MRNFENVSVLEMNFLLEFIAFKVSFTFHLVHFWEQDSIRNLYKHII